MTNTLLPYVGKQEKNICFSEIINFCVQVEELMKAFIEPQLGCCPLIWMFHSRGVNNKINHLHERSLRIVYKDNISSFEDLLKKDRSFTIHQMNIQSLATELFKVKGNLLKNIMYDIFQTREITTTWGHKPTLLVFV